MAQKKMATVVFPLVEKLGDKGPLWASLVAQMVKNLPAMQETRFAPWVGKIWRREWVPTPVLLPGECHGHRSLACHGITE